MTSTQEWLADSGPAPRAGTRVTLLKAEPVPMPDVRHPMKYPWADMRPGHCLFIECEPMKRDTIRNRITSTAHHWFTRHRPGWQVVTRRVKDGVRVWVVEGEK